MRCKIETATEIEAEMIRFDEQMRLSQSSVDRRSIVRKQAAGKFVTSVVYARELDEGEVIN